LTYNTSELLLNFNVQKGFFRKDYVTKAIARVPLGSLPLSGESVEWHEVDEPSTFKKMKPVEGAKNIGQVRLQISVREGVPAVDEDRLTGIVRPRRRAARSLPSGRPGTAIRSSCSR
jgi:hypothetical protein